MVKDKFKFEICKVPSDSNCALRKTEQLVQAQQPRDVSLSVLYRQRGDTEDNEQVGDTNAKSKFVGAPGDDKAGQASS